MKNKENFQDVLEDTESFVLRHLQAHIQNTIIHILEVHPKMHLQIKDSIIVKYPEIFLVH